MSATDDEKLPWLAAEKRLIAEAVEADRPSGAVSSQMAREWANVPEYAESLEHVRGPGALERLIVQLEKGADQMTGHARTLFER